jgi:hypothetical protein
MALGTPVASVRCVVGSIARFDILEMIWRNGRVRVGFVLLVARLYSTSMNNIAYLMIRCEKIVVMHGNAVVSCVVIRHAYCVPDSGHSRSE